MHGLNVINEMEGSMDMEDKFRMTIDDNIFWAKRNIVDTIYKNAKLEGISVTFPQTQAIIEGGMVSNVSTTDIQKVLAMRDAWEFMLDTLEYPSNYAYLCKLHELSACDVPAQYRGRLRNIPVKMGGTSWVPQFPIESQIKEELEDINTIENLTERAITAMLWCMRRQMFMDGNKRTAMLFANKLLVSNGLGIISIDENSIQRFGELLIEYYETGNMENIKWYVYDNALSGFDSQEIELDKESQQPSDDECCI